MTTGVNKRTKPNALLIELVIVLLFFSLSASVILQLFVATHDKSLRSRVDSAAMAMAEDLADRFYTSDLDAEAFFAADGWRAVDGSRERDVQIEQRNLRFVVSGAQTVAAAGVLDDLTLSVYDGDLNTITLAIARYRGGEVRP